jgi:two-component system chemotaxis response regulator CheB
MEKVKAGIDKLILIGGSAGSLEVLFRLIPELPAGFSYPVAIVLHRKDSGDSPLTELLAAKSSLIIKEIEDKDPLTAGRIHLAPGDYHLLFEQDGTLALDDSEKVAFSRPSIDVSFQSASEVYGASLVCILLSGANSDGTAGLLYAREAGGTTVVQSPEEASVAYMPQYAIEQQAADHVLDTAGIIAFLRAL